MTAAVPAHLIEIAFRAAFPGWDKLTSEEQEAGRTAISNAIEAIGDAGFAIISGDLMKMFE